MRLQCSAESTQAPLLRWYKDDEPIAADDARFRLLAGGPVQARGKETASAELTLVIDSVQAGATTGNYHCLASNSEGSVRARSSVALAVPPVIGAPPRNATRFEGDKVELSCQARALPANVTYKWFLNDVPVERALADRHQVRRDGTLVIHAATRDEQGVYTCRASNGLLARSGELIEASASAHLAVEFPARVTHSPPVQYLPAGLSGVIRCFVLASPAVEFFTWTRDNAQFEPNLDANLERLSNGSLLVKHVSKAYEGKYRCTPFNKHGSAGSSAAMDVRVEEPPYFTLKPAELYKAPLGADVKIPCDAKGSPKPSVTWRRVLDARLAPASVPQAPATTESASNQAGDASAGVGAGSDHDDEHPSDKHLYPSSAMSLEQTIERAGPPAQRNDPDMQQPVISYAKLPSDRADFRRSSLHLRALKKEDHGKYECVVENQVATLVVSTMLYIEGESSLSLSPAFMARQANHTRRNNSSRAHRRPR